MKEKGGRTRVKGGRSTRYLRLSLLFILHPSTFILHLFADDTGIDKARLIEQPNAEYLIEVDTLPRLAGAYREPVFPSRFEMIGEIQRDRRPGYLAIRFRFKSSGEPLSAGDTILLPWARSGISLTVQWSDGQLNQGLFLRDVAGIEIDIGTFKTTSHTKQSITKEQFLIGLRHALLGACHVLLVLSVSLLSRKFELFKMLALFAFGTSLSLVLVDVGMPFVPQIVVEICMLVAALLFARSAAIGHDHSISRFLPIMLILGLLDGLGYYQVLHDSDVTKDNVLAGLFGFALGVNLLQFLLGAICVIAIGVIRKLRWEYLAIQSSQMLVGGCSAAMIALVVTGIAAPFESSDLITNQSKEVELPPRLGQAMVKRPNTRRVLAKQADNPLTGYLTIEPFEVRLELLAHVEAVSGSVNLDLDYSSVIPVDRQDGIAGEMQRRFGESLQLKIDGQSASPGFVQANFVQVTTNGIVIRENPIPEPFESAVVGLVYAFETDELADIVELKWRLFLDDTPSIPFSILDPFSSQQTALSENNPVLRWSNTLVGYQAPQARPVPVSRISFPVASIGLAFLCALVWIWRESIPLGRVLVYSGLAVATLAYPYIRWSYEIPAANAWLIKRNEAATILDDLLTNAYRAFEIRDEEKVYDRLALCVMGEQLREFYLQSRKSMEIQERGGARARIDKVEILEIKSVSGTSSGEIEMKGSWIASGSVNHFGHTHYRNNVYDAIVTIVPVDGVWKIKQIQITDEFSFL